MGVVSWQAAASNDRALRVVLERLAADDRDEGHAASVDIAGVWRIEVDQQGRLVATHGASGVSTVLASPPQQQTNDGEGTV